MENVKCEVCRNEFPVYKYRFKYSKHFFCGKECYGEWRFKKFVGEKHPRWKGGRFKDTDGYIRILMPNHPDCSRQGYILEHRYLIEQKVGRFLLKTEAVHHINGIKDDNNIDNLVLLTTQAHNSLSTKERWEKGLMKFPLQNRNNQYTKGRKHIIGGDTVKDAPTSPTAPITEVKP